MMKRFVFLLVILLQSISAQSSQIYQCKDAYGRLIFQDAPCDGDTTGRQIKTKVQASVQAKIELTGEQLDQLMWVLLEEPYRSDRDKFIEHVRENNLVAKIDSDGDSVLGIAALNGQAEVIDYLVSHGADVDNKNKRGYTALSFAMKLTNSVKQSLLDHGADINHAGEQGRTPLINAVLFNDRGTVNFLLKRGADANQIDAQGASALFYAASRGNMDIVKSLVESGADVNAGAAYRPLKGAITNKNLLIATYLTFKGARL